MNNKRTFFQYVIPIDSEYDTTNPKDENHAWEGVYINKVVAAGNGYSDGEQYYL